VVLTAAYEWVAGKQEATLYKGVVAVVAVGDNCWDLDVLLYVV